MKVSECEKCAYYKRCVYSNYYRPAGYHPIGMSHAYGYCIKHQDRCLNIKRCDLNNKKEENAPEINSDLFFHFTSHPSDDNMRTLIIHGTMMGPTDYATTLTLNKEATNES